MWEKARDLVVHNVLHCVEKFTPFVTSENRLSNLMNDKIVPAAALYFPPLYFFSKQNIIPRGPESISNQYYYYLYSEYIVFSLCPLVGHNR